MIKLIPFAIIFIGFNTNATTIKPVKSVINNVTVFTQAAQVFRTSSVTLSPGVTNLVFSGVSPFINPASLQAGGKGNFVVLGVKHQVKYPEPPKQRDGILPKEILREIANLEDSLVELGFNRDELTAQKEALQLEKDMIMKLLCPPSTYQRPSA